MFTGIIEELGEIIDVAPSGDGARLTVRAPIAVSDASHGDSIAVSGVCLTVVEQAADGFTADVMKQTLDMSTLAGAAPGRRVNIERATATGGRLGGHIVQGHVDGVGTVLARTPSEHWEVVEVAMPEEMGRYLVDKGSITVDGVSLTVVEARLTSFTVSLIPETLARTTLGHRQVGDRVNLETDVIAKHVAKLVAAYLPTAAGEQHSKEQQA